MRGIIVEDELLAARHLQSVLRQIGTIQVIAVLDSIAETVEWFFNNPQPEIVFMDIHLADGSAFEIFNQVEINCPIVFTTAYDEYALKAFKVNSVDYLLKPIDKKDVDKALAKIQHISSQANFQASIHQFVNSFSKPPAYKSHFLIPAKGDKLIPVQACDIAFFYIDTGIVKAFTIEEKTYRFEHSLDELAEMLDPKTFFRANRQYIISRPAIKDIDLWFNRRLSVNLKISVPEKILISKTRIPEFKNWFGES
jgi:DNA-binding LytR/AlgR family response regulator